MTEFVRDILRDIVHTIAWLRLCSPDEPQTLSEWVLQALTCLLRLLVAAAIMAGTVYLATRIAGGVL